MRTLPSLDTDAQSLAFHPQSGALAVTSWNALFFWDPVSGQQSRHAWLVYGRSNTTTLTFSPDGRWALLDYHLIDMTAVLGESAFPERRWCSPDGNPLLRPQPLDGVDHSTRLALAGDGRRLVGVGPRFLRAWTQPGARGRRKWQVDPTVRSLLAPSGTRGDSHASWAPSPVGGCRSLALTPDGRFFAVVVEPYGTVVLWEVDGVRPLRLLAHGTATHRVLFSPDGRFLAVGEGGGSVQLWDVSNLDDPGSVRKVTRLFTEFEPTRGRVHALAFSPDGGFLAAGNDSGVVHVWEVGTWHEVAALDWQVGAIRSLAFSPDGLTAACAGAAGRVIVWDVDA